MFCYIPEELEKELFDHQGIANPRIKKIARTQMDFFFARDVFNKDLNGDLNTANTVDCFDRFQGLVDIQNEFRKILYKPLLALKLAANHQLNSDWGFLFTVVDVLTGESAEATALNIIYEFALSVFYGVYAVVLCADALLEFTLRCAISLVEEACELPFKFLFDGIGINTNKSAVPSENVGSGSDAPINSAFKTSVEAVNVEVLESISIEIATTAIRL